MSIDDILAEIRDLTPKDKETFYLKVMDDYFKTMMSNQKFMEEAFHCMSDYLVRMKTMGLDAEGILSDMSAGIGMGKAKAA